MDKIYQIIIQLLPEEVSPEFMREVANLEEDLINELDKDESCGWLDGHDIGFNSGKVNIFIESVADTKKTVSVINNLFKDLNLFKEFKADYIIAQSKRESEMGEFTRDSSIILYPESKVGEVFNH